MVAAMSDPVASHIAGSLEKVWEAGVSAMITANVTAARFQAWADAEDEADEYQKAAEHYYRSFSALADGFAGPLIKRYEPAGAAAILRQAAAVMDDLYTSEPAREALAERAQARQRRR